MRISDWSSDVCSSDLIRALRRRRLGLAHIANDGDQVVLDLLEVKINCRDRAMHDAGLVGTELGHAGLGVLDRGRDIGGDRAGLWVRHQSARAEPLPSEPTTSLQAG